MHTKLFIIFGECISLSWGVPLRFWGGVGVPLRFWGYAFRSPIAVLGGRGFAGLRDKQEDCASPSPPAGTPIGVALFGRWQSRKRRLVGVEPRGGLLA